MSITDPISDMFTRIRNALSVQHEEVSVPFSRTKLSIAKILLTEGFISAYKLLDEDLKKKFIKIKLKYRKNNDPLISVIRSVSRPGRRYYVKKKEIPKVLNGFGINIISTSKGVMTGKDARKNLLGGELLGEVH
ncbi:MAG: 30S ribosomal protein S8 [Candidatus Margulisbacteria bacterium]|nr:30S ribosomal protein S8 [Candidatus Margulisiibacteriota bacterium]